MGGVVYWRGDGGGGGGYHLQYQLEVQCLLPREERSFRELAPRLRHLVREPQLEEVRSEHGAEDRNEHQAASAITSSEAHVASVGLANWRSRGCVMCCGVGVECM